MKVLLFAMGADRPHQAGHYVYANLRAPFVKAGHEVIDVDFDREIQQHGKEAMCQRLKALILQEQPDLFFHVIVEDELDPSLASFIRDQTATTSMVFFSDDDWRMSHSLQWVTYYNVALTTSPEAYSRYRKLGHDHVLLTPYACNPDWYYPLSTEKAYDVTFVGQAYRGRPELLSWLKNQGVNLRVWGSGWEEYPDLRNVAGGFLPHWKMLEVFAKSRIVLGLSWCSIDGATPQIKGRTFEYPACQAFQLASFDENLEKFFEVGTEIVMFHDRQELLEKIQFYLSHEEEAQAIATSAYRRTIQEHTWEKRYSRLFQDISHLHLRGKKPLSFFENTHPEIKKPLLGKVTPKVSIICYVFNGEAYIKDLIQSVIAQTFQDFEFLILDDGSTDDTKQIVESFLDDPRVRYVYQTNIGQGKNFHLLINRCLELTEGELVCAVGSDDVLMPEKLKRQVGAFDAEPSLDVVFTDGVHIDRFGQTLQSDFRFPEARAFSEESLLRILFQKNIIAHPTTMLKREAIERMGGFEGGFATDYQFWLKSASHLKFRYLDEKLLKYRIHAEGASTGEGNQTLPETIKLLLDQRARCTILDLYPEIQESSNMNSSLYQAYVRFGNTMLTANIPVLPLAIQEYQRALQHRPDGVEALNNLGVCLWLAGEQEKSREVFLHLEPQKGRSSIIQNNWNRFKINQSHQNDQGIGWQLFTEFLPQEIEYPKPESPQSLTLITKTNHHLPREGHVMAEHPLVSVIVPTVNRPEFLVRAIKSILNQTYRAFEVIVINDGGEDVGEMLSTIDVGGRIVYLRLPKSYERSYARNMGIRAAKGKYIAYLDDDDQYLPDHLETLVTFLENSEYQVAYTDAFRVVHEHQHGRYVETHRDVPYSYEFSRENLLRENYIPILSIMHSRSCLDRAGLFDESLNTHEDWDLWIRMSELTPFCHIKKVTAEFSWRMDGSTTTSSRQGDFKETKARIHERYGNCGLQEMEVVTSLPERIVSSESVQKESFACSIIIPVFNKVELTQQCLTNLAKVTDQPTYEVIVIDNASSDGTNEFLSELGGDVQVIRNEENLGFAKACNQGAAIARGQYLVFLNNDTIPKPEWLIPLVDEVEAHEHVAVVGSKLLYPDETIQHAGVVISRKYGTPYHFLLGAKSDLPTVNERREYQAVTAACMLVRKGVFSEVGGFDETYVNGFEDVDFCLKIRAAGKTVVYQPKSCLYHLESQTVGRKAKDAENAQRFWDRWNHEWVEDEDIKAFEIGCAAKTELKDSGTSFVLAPLLDPQEKAKWEKVVQVQKILLGAKKVKLDGLERKDLLQPLLQDSQSWPMDVGALEWGGRVCEILGCDEEANRFWERLLTVADHPNARIGLARSAIKRGNSSEAQAHLDILGTKFPQKGERWNLQGVLWMQSQNFAGAKEAFSRALNLDPLHKKAMLGLGMACMGLGDGQKAYDQFILTCESYPDDVEVIDWVIQAGTALECWPSLGNILEGFLNRNPADCERRFALASVRYRAGELLQAKQEFDRLKLLQPHFDGLKQLGDLLTSPSAADHLVTAQ